jgi:hypothetical protein
VLTLPQLLHAPFPALTTPCLGAPLTVFSQVTLIKQEKVPCLSDNAAHLCLEPSDPFALQTKPHGHGDVHSLLHSSGLAKAWQQQGLKWVCFFQVRPPCTSSQDTHTFRALQGLCFLQGQSQQHTHQLPQAHSNRHTVVC